MERSSLPILFAEIKEKQRDQLEGNRSIDIKAGVTLGVQAAIFVGLVNADWFRNLPNEALLSVLLPFLFSVACMLNVIRVRSLKKDPDPIKFIEGYQAKSETETVAQLTRNYANNYSENEILIEDKKTVSNIGFIFLFFAIIILTMIIMIVRR